MIHDVVIKELAAHAEERGSFREVMYLTSRVYNPAAEGRISHDDPAIGYDWLKGPAIT